MNIECYHNIHKDQKVKGFLDYHYCSELEEVVQYNVYEVLEDNYIENINYICIYAHGSRIFGNPRKDSDLDFVLFYKGTIREDKLFNIFADESIYIEHVKCDFNPIQIVNESDIEYYIQKHDIEYHQVPLQEALQNIKLALDDYQDIEPTNSISHYNDVIDSEDVIKQKIEFWKEVVDLGLPSKTLWCKYNLDVNSNQLTKPEDWYGKYYAWGELEGNKTDEDGDIYFGWYNYNFGKQHDQLTKYCNDSEHGLRGFTDNLIQLLPEDDAAYQFKKCHNFKFHIPTKEQCEELINCTTSYWVNNYDPNKIKHNPEDDGGIQGLNGRVFVGKNANQLFIPAAGYYNGSALYRAGAYCWAWSSSLHLDRPDNAYHLRFYDDGVNPQYGSNRYCGLSVRPAVNL